MGWASMETRLAMRRLPRVGDRIQSFSAVLALADKTSHRILWAYDVEREDLLVSFEIVNLAFDIAARAPMSIPDNIRAAETTMLHRDLAPRAPSGATRPLTGRYLPITWGMRRKPGQLLDLEARILVDDGRGPAAEPRLHGFALASRSPTSAGSTAAHQSRHALQGPRPDSRARAR